MAKGDMGANPKQFGGGGGFNSNVGSLGMGGQKPQVNSAMQSKFGGSGMGGSMGGMMPQPQQQQNKFDPAYQASQMGRYMPPGHGSPQDQNMNSNQGGAQDYFTQIRNNQQPNMKQTGMENMWLPPSMTGTQTPMSIGDIFGRGGFNPGMGGGEQRAQAPGLQPQPEMQAQLPAYGGNIWNMNRMGPIMNNRGF